MHRSFVRRLLILLLSVCLLPVNTPAKADSLQTHVNWIVVGIGATGAAVGIGIFYAFHHSSSIKGCAVSGPNGLELQNEGDRQTFQLLGITADVKPGDRVRVNGKHKKLASGSSGNPTFLVDKLANDYGACQAALVKP